MSSKIYTRTGDGGDTSLADGTRLPKDAARVEAYGAVDEANAWVSAARAHLDEPDLDPMLEFVQHRLYNCSSSLAMPEGSGRTPIITPADVTCLEVAINQLEEATGPVKVFVLPGGTRGASLLHVARTVCRRAERRVVTLVNAGEPVDRLVLKFLNRASDFLFAAARFNNREGGDTAWDKDLPRPG